MLRYQIARIVAYFKQAKHDMRPMELGKNALHLIVKNGTMH